MMMKYDIVHITSLFENASEGFVIADDKGIIILVNPSACSMFGYTAKQLVGNPIEILVPKQFAKSHVKQREAFHKHPSSRKMGQGRELYGAKKNGDVFPVEVSLSNYEQDKKKYCIAFIIDISQRKQIELNMLAQQQQLEKVTSELQKLNVELEEKVAERTAILKEALQKLEQSQSELSEALDKERQLNEIKSRFVSMASHEFRTPLSTVLSSALLLDKYVLTEEQPKREKHIERIKNSVKHLNDLLEDFLSVGKLEEGKVETVCESFLLPDLIHETIEEMKGLARNGQELVYHHSGDKTITSDRKLLKNILFNLISNAIKFSEDNSAISITSKISSKAVSIAVEDKGIGIAPEDMDHLFSSFFRGQNAVNIQGTGMGLHIIKRYLDLLKGDISIKSKLNKGTTVRIELPLKKS